MTAAALFFVVLGSVFEFTAIILLAVETGRASRSGGGEDAGTPPVAAPERSVEARLAAIERFLVRLPTEIRAGTEAARRQGVRLRGWSAGLLLTGIALLAIGNVLALLA